MSLERKHICKMGQDSPNLRHDAIIGHFPRAKSHGNNRADTLSIRATHSAGGFGCFPFDYDRPSRILSFDRSFTDTSRRRYFVTRPREIKEDPSFPPWSNRADVTVIYIILYQSTAPSRKIMRDVAVFFIPFVKRKLSP